LVAAVAALLAPQTAAALSPGSFAPTASMTVIRNGPAAAPLANGRVLVAGGNLGIGFSQGADLYDPAAGTFSMSTGTMASGRFAPVAAPLLDGRVLVAGGFNGSYLETADIYDPATDSFSATGSMGVKRIAAAAAPLPDGRVLVVGGFDGTTYLQSAEIYDPGTAGWTPTGSMSVPRFAPAAAPLPDGRVLVAGGYYYDGTNHWLQSAEIYDPATGSFSPTGAMAEQREGPAAAPLPDGRVLVAGGTFNDGADHYLQSAELYDPVTGSFSAAGAMTSRRYAAAAAPLTDGRVLVAGGNAGSNRLQSAELFSLGPHPGFVIRLRGKSLIFTAPVAGTVTVSDAASKAAATAAKKKKKKGLSLRSSSASGGPGEITVALKLVGKAKKRFKATGKVKVKAKISFAPKSECLTRFFKSCYDSGTAPAKLTIKKTQKKK
jgi:hypothetical protein